MSINVWNSKSGRVSEKIVKHSFVGGKCSAIDCNLIFQSVSEMHGCKSVPIRVGATPADIKLINEALAIENLSLSETCDCNERYQLNSIFPFNISLFSDLFIVFLAHRRMEFVQHVAESQKLCKECY